MTESIEEITEVGIRTVDGQEHEVDTIIYATGEPHLTKRWPSGHRMVRNLRWILSSMLQVGHTLLRGGHQDTGWSGI